MREARLIVAIKACAYFFSKSKEMYMRLLPLMSLLTVHGLRPVYDCGKVCSKTIKSKVIEEYVFKTEKTKQNQVLFQFERDSTVQLYMARRYTSTEFELHINGVKYDNFTYSGELDAMLQVTKYEISDENVVSGDELNITMQAMSRTLNWSVKYGKDDQIDAMQLLALPFDMILYHGDYWSNQFHDWIFFATTFVMAAFIISTSVKLRGLVRSSLVYATAAFSASFAAKLYHLILASMRVDLNVMIFLVTFAELLPLAVCYVFSLTYRRYMWLASILLVLLTSAFLFAGLGYFIGNGFLVLSVFALMCEKVLKKLC